MAWPTFLAKGLYSFAFTSYIISKGVTTNEYFKWKEVKAWHIKATENCQDALLNDAETDSENFPASFHGNKDMDMTCTGPVIAGRASNFVSQAGVDEETNGVVTNPEPMPTNVYALDVFTNFNEVMFPPSLRNLQARQKHI
jgi:hypothetical protein